MTDNSNIDEILRKVFILGLNRGKDKDALYMMPLEGMSFPEYEQAIQQELLKARIDELNSMIKPNVRYYGDAANLVMKMNNRLADLQNQIQAS